MKIFKKIKSFWKWRVCKWWYKFRYGVTIGTFDGTMFPVLGEGQFVSVLRNGPYLEITANVKYPGVKQGTIRIIPYQPNHGFMIEFVHPDGRIGSRSHCDYRQLVLMAEGKYENHI